MRGIIEIKGDKQPCMFYKKLKSTKKNTQKRRWNRKKRIWQFSLRIWDASDGLKDSESHALTGEGSDKLSWP